MIVIRSLFALLAICVLTYPASAQSLKAHKDRLFAYPKVLEQGYDGDYLKLDYRSSRDIDDRDEVRGARVQSYYINMRPRRSQEELSLNANGRTIDYARVGKPKGAKWIVIFLHGRNGDRSLGMNDWSFGGNFNRIKNLAVRNRGLYITPTITNFEAQGAADVAAIAARYKGQAPKAKLILACGSMGAQICWQYLNGTSKLSGIDGAIMLGAFADNGFLATPAATGGGRPFRSSSPMALTTMHSALSAPKICFRASKSLNPITRPACFCSTRAATARQSV